MAGPILVIDDSATLRRVVHRTLIQDGYDVDVAPDGATGLRIAEDRPPALILLDFVMPNMNGYQFCQAMKGIRNLSQVAVVLMSAKADKIGDGFLAQTGAVDTLQKPFSPEALLAVVGHAINRLEQRRPHTHPPPSPLREHTLAHIPQIPRHDVAPLSTSENAGPLLDAAADALSLKFAELFTEFAPGTSAEVVRAALRRRYEPRQLFDFTESLARLVPGRGGETSFEGRIEHVPLGEIFQLLQHQMQTGVLQIDRIPVTAKEVPADQAPGEGPTVPTSTVSVCLKDGAVQLALGGLGEQEFRLGRYLLRERLIDSDDLDRISRSRPGPGLLGAHLMKLGYISAQELRQVLIRQTSELIYEAIRWRKGTYRFHRFAQRPEAEDAALNLPIASVLMESLRRVDEWRLIQEQVQSFDQVPLQNPQTSARADLDRLSADEKLVFSAADGQRNVRELVTHCKMASFDVCKILFSLLTSRLLLMGPES